jgi:hypothetical protein
MGRLAGQAAIRVSAIEYVRSAVLPAALSMLPQRMDSLEARAMLLAIGMQESRFAYRRQMKGPALSFWQAESTGGFAGLVTHPATRELVIDILQRMGYGEPDLRDFQALEDNDILACIGARLLLWTHPSPLPEGDPNAAWLYYLSCWRPGKPHRESWDAIYLDAWAREVNS